MDSTRSIPTHCSYSRVSAAASFRSMASSPLKFRLRFRRKPRRQAHPFGFGAGVPGDERGGSTPRRARTLPGPPDVAVHAPGGSWRVCPPGPGHSLQTSCRQADRHTTPWPAGTHTPGLRTHTPERAPCRMGSAPQSDAEVGAQDDHQKCWRRGTRYRAQDCPQLHPVLGTTRHTR